MKNILIVPGLLMMGASGLTLMACSDSPLDPVAVEATALVSIAPQGGAIGVDRFAPVVIEFNHEVAAGMERYALLHRGDVTGPEVAGSWAMSQDLLTLTFTPAAPLEPNASYTIHLGGGMMDADGRHVDFQAHGSHMGGSWATGGMMGGGMMGGAMDEKHMGQGWQHPHNGSYGMVFAFTTGS